ncbi:MAG: hypothetical protein ABR969_01105 [Sedimentisphaerales bacterium]|jgi:hypothetical protein
MALGWFNAFWTWLKQLITLPANLAKVASINKDLELQQKLLETQQRLQEAEQRLAKYDAVETGRLFFSNNVYWARNADGTLDTSPYCARCFDLNGKPIRLVVRQRGIFRIAKCPECRIDEIPLGDEPQ